MFTKQIQETRRISQAQVPSSPSLLPPAQEESLQQRISSPRSGSFRTLNNSAVSLLHHGDGDDEALQLLNNALLLAPGAPSLLLVGTNIASPPPASPSCCYYRSRTISPPCIHTVNADDSTSESADFAFEKENSSSGSPGNFFVLFNRAFIFEDLDRGDWSPFYPHIQSAILFNLGLIWHRMAVRENSTEKYCKAHEHYSSAYLLLQQNALFSLYHAQICDVLLLALINNIGHIHSHFLRLQDARRCVEELFAVFFLIENKKVLTKEEYVFFYMGILLVVNRKPVLAPAA